MIQCDLSRSVTRVVAFLVGFPNAPMCVRKRTWETLFRKTCQWAVDQKLDDDGCSITQKTPRSKHKCTKNIMFAERTLENQTLTRQVKT